MGLLFLLPSLLWALVKEHRNRKSLKGSFLYIIFISIVISLWINYIYLEKSNFDEAATELRMGRNRAPLY